ncbi:RicAFT regulatory complex protein RicA family protein [Gottfriedia luciferensis]|uniref:RicAFT regulatory complex protein RicA family protein n=1 Tax=Gottfriedia luciferensis TaxID=178774 RepID=UPI000B42D35D|nr:RicAFT regulatory complex protein RicA family protein [Gottfriedia luciferensis]
MGKYSKADIVERAKELAVMISETEEVDFFKRAEAQINESESVRAYIEEIKSLQKQAVNLEHWGKKEALKKVEQELDELNEKLESIPIVQQFQSSQVEVNGLLQLIAHTISNGVTDEIIKSTGGNLLSGETGSKVANGPSGCSTDSCSH